MTDPRRNLVSGSSMARAAECPGSVAMEKEIKQTGRFFELPDPNVLSGTRIHAWNAQQALGRKPETELNSNEFATAQKCLELRQALLDSWRRDAQNNGDIDLVIEKRFWYRRGLVPLFSAQVDIAAIDRKHNRALIMDYKTGRLEVDEAADNLQLRSEVVLLKHNFPELEEISASIIEPWVSWDSVEVLYKGDDLRQAENQILTIVERTIWEADRRFAGPWCKHCQAKTWCNEAIAYAQGIQRFDPERMIMELPRGPAGTQLWERIQVAQKLLEAFEAAYKQILESEPDALPGYILPERGRARRRVPDPGKLKFALAQYLSGPEIDGCADYRVAKIEEFLGLKHRIEDKKELARVFKELTKDVIAISYDEPFIRALTRKERETPAKIPIAKSN